MSSTPATPDSVFDSATALTATAVARAVTNRFDDEPLGVMVESPPTINPPALIEALDRASAHTVGLALANIDEADVEALQTVCRGTDIRVTDDLSTAVKWRNERETEFDWDGAHVPDRIVVMARGDPAKIGSLHRLKTLPLGDVRDALATLLSEQSAFQGNQPAQAVWAALADGIGGSIGLEELARYGVACRCESEQESVEALGSELHELGLFTDSDLLVNDPAERLTANRDAVNRIIRITNRDRRRLMNSIRAKSGTLRNTQAKFVERLRRLQRQNDRAVLGEIEYSDVRDALETSSQVRSVTDHSSETDTEDDEHSGNGSTNGRGKSQLNRRSDHSTASVELALRGDDDELGELLGDFDDDFEEAVEKEERRIELRQGDDDLWIVDVDPDTYRFIDAFVGESRFGGIVSGATDRADAIENWSGLELTPFDISAADSSFERLRGFADRNDEFEGVVSAAERYEQKRKPLVDALPRLLNAPHLTLLGDADLLEDCRAYLEAYQDLQKTLENKYRAFKDISSKGATRLLSEFLLLDIILIETDAGRELILSPLHPLHLWKYVEIATEVASNPENLSEDERSFIEQTVEEQPHVLRSLTIGGGPFIPEKTYLVQSAEVVGLPVYTEADRAEPGSNAHLWEYLIEKLTAAYPPSRARLKLSIVDPIDTVDVLDTLSDAAESGLVEGADVEFVFINSERGDLLQDATSTQEENILNVFGPDNDANAFTIRTRECRSIDQYATAVVDDPRHCIVINDHSSFYVEEFERDLDTEIHPLYVPKEFDYDEFEQEISISAATEGPLFSNHQNLVNELFNHRQQTHQSGVHEITTTPEEVEQLLQGSIWTVLSIPAANSDPFWEDQLISKEHRGDRDYGIYSDDLDLFVRTLRRVLSEYPIAPDDADVAEIAERIAADQRSGLLRLLTEETIGQADSRNTRGLLGAIIAVQWLEETYAEPKLIFSIDDPRTRNWLNFGDATRRADYLVVQRSNSGLDLTVVEVKTLAEPDTAFSVDHASTPPTITGDAVDQVVETVETLRSLFTDNESVATPPRRELLREQLYYELVGTGETEDRGAWADQINAVFHGDADISVHPQIVSVEIENSTKSPVSIDATTDEAKQVSATRLPRRTIVRLLMNGTDEYSTDLAAEDGEPVETSSEETDRGPASDDDASDDSSTATTTGDERGEAETQGGFGAGTDYTDEVEQLKRILSEYDIRVRGIDPENVDVGPNIVRYKIELAPEERQEKLTKRSADIARRMALEQEPRIYRLSGTKFVAMDVPRDGRDIVQLDEYLDALPPESETNLGELPFVAGVQPDGTAHLADLHQAPHMLVGGSTGSGKTVFLYSLLTSLLSQQGPEGVRLAIIDPKLTNFMMCSSLPNLETGQVITESQEAFDLVEWLVDDEIPRRTDVLAKSGSVDITEHNERSDEPLTPLVVIVDEYADLVDDLSNRSGDFETNVRRIAQRARSVGIHLVISTQRPSAKIIDTDLRANLDMRVAFRLPSDSDSRVILDDSGAEDLAGNGDMLFKHADRMIRLQGTLVEPDALRELVAKFN